VGHRWAGHGVGGWAWASRGCRLGMAAGCVLWVTDGLDVVPVGRKGGELGLGTWRCEELY
jgi:hypothetical protein